MMRRKPPIGGQVSIFGYEIPMDSPMWEVTATRIYLNDRAVSASPVIVKAADEKNARLMGGAIMTCKTRKNEGSWYRLVDIRATEI